MLHILIGQAAFLEPVVKAGSDEIFRWTLPKAAQVGDAALLYFPSESAVVARAEILSSPEPGNFGKASVYLADVGKVVPLGRRVTIEELKAKFGDWGWPRYPRTYTSATGTLELDLLRFVDGSKVVAGALRAPKTYLLTWNPTRWEWHSLNADALRSRLGDVVEMRWSCGNTKRIAAGDRVFLMRLGAEPRGIVASGWARTPPSFGAHWEYARADEGDQALYVDAEFECILDVPENPAFDLVDLKRKLPAFNWTPQASGNEIPPEVAAQLEDAWAAHVGRAPTSLVGEFSAIEGEFEIRYVRHRRREQYIKQAKIKAVLATAGRLACEVPGCGFDFEERYGSAARGLAIVHHLKPLASFDGPRLTRLEDVAIVCANCHAFIHYGGACRALSELKAARAP